MNQHGSAAQGLVRVRAQILAGKNLGGGAGKLGLGQALRQRVHLKWWTTRIRNKAGEAGHRAPEPALAFVRRPGLGLGLVA
jgi:hypothetical protein